MNKVDAVELPVETLFYQPCIYLDIYPNIAWILFLDSKVVHGSAAKLSSPRVCPCDPPYLDEAGLCNTHRHPWAGKFPVVFQILSCESTPFFFNSHNGISSLNGIAFSINQIIGCLKYSVVLFCLPREKTGLYLPQLGYFIISRGFGLRGIICTPYRYLLWHGLCTYDCDCFSYRYLDCPRDSWLFLTSVDWDISAIYMSVIKRSCL